MVVVDVSTVLVGGGAGAAFFPGPLPGGGDLAFFPGPGFGPGFGPSRSFGGGGALINTFFVDICPST